MKRFLSISVLAVSLILVFVFAPERSLTASSSVIGRVKPPIKVLAVRLDAANAQPKGKSTQQPTWLDGLEVQIENTSGKPIQYLVVNLDVPVLQSEKPLRIPMSYGQAFADSRRSKKIALFAPGTKLDLKPSKNTCESMRARITATGLIPRSDAVVTNVQVVLFEDSTSWLAGRTHHRDPNNLERWISDEELTRTEPSAAGLFGMKYSKANYSRTSNFQPCFRYTGFHLNFCCTDFDPDGQPVDFYVGEAQFTGDPNGHVQPNSVETCCTQSPNECCTYDEIAGCS